MSNLLTSPIPTSRRLRVVRDEASPPYDGMSQAPAREPAVRRHMTVIVDSVVDEVAATCGMAAAGLYMVLERRVGKDGAWECTARFLAESFSQTERHVLAAARTLEDAGFLERTPVYGPRGMNKGSRWFLPKHLRTNGGEVTPEVRGEVTPEASRAHVKEISNSQVITSSTASPDPPTKPLPENGTAQQIVKAFCLVARIEQPANYKKTVGQAQMLARAGVTPEDIPALYEYVAGWAKGADLGLMLNQVDRWRSSRNAPVANGGNHNKGGRMKVVL